MKDISRSTKNGLVVFSVPWTFFIFFHLSGSEIAVYEGDILLRRGRRSAINCESCLWPKSQDGLVKVPINISSDFCECMQMDAAKLALICKSLNSVVLRSCGMH